MLSGMITVKFFASLRQKLGRSEIQFPLDDPAPVSEVITRLSDELPNLRRAIDDTKSMTAINHEFADQSALVKAGDELAFIPPMSGGSDELVRIQSEDFSVENEIDRIRLTSRKIGGIVTFLGTARELSKGRTIREMEFEYYPVMAEKKLAWIREQALKDHDIIEVGIVHRYGPIGIGDNIVLIVVAAEHRADAFTACQWCIDELKQITPIWKKEITDTGEIWVEEHP